MLDRLVNIFFFLALIYVFILFADAQDHRQILTAMSLAGVFSLLVFIFNWLTIDGATAAFIFGSIAYGIGGISGAIVVLGFFLSASIISKNNIGEDGFSQTKFRRDGNQVWANGFWFVIWIFAWYMSDQEAFQVAAITGIAAANADTWATEIGGNRLHSKTWLITTRQQVQPGSDGGISIWGSIAALAGAIFVGLLFWGFEKGVTFTSFSMIAIAGFLGCMIDSYIGARFQNRDYKFSLPSVMGAGRIYVSNNAVNWISAGLASFISLILILIIGA